MLSADSKNVVGQLLIPLATCSLLQELCYCGTAFCDGPYQFPEHVPLDYFRVVLIPCPFRIITIFPVSFQNVPFSELSRFCLSLGYIYTQGQSAPSPIFQFLILMAGPECCQHIEFSQRSWDHYHPFLCISPIAFSRSLPSKLAHNGLIGLCYSLQRDCTCGTVKNGPTAWSQMHPPPTCL
jgi:hypothetical protein